MTSPTTLQRTPGRGTGSDQGSRCWAGRYIIDRGWHLAHIPPRCKIPDQLGWQNSIIGIEDVPAIWRNDADNLGLVLGSRLADVDLDCPEALAIADYFLPRTGVIWGRRSAPSSHRLCVSTNGAFKFKQYLDPLRPKSDAGDGHDRILVELRTGAHQSLLPPSIHPDGEAYVWHSFDEPSEVAPDELARAVGKLAAACLLSRYWPTGSRNQAAMALAGGLLRSGWTPADTGHFIEAVALAAGDTELSNRVRTVQYTESALQAEKHATGWPTLAELLGQPVVDCVLRWLGLATDDTERIVLSSRAIDKPQSNSPSGIEAETDAGLLSKLAVLEAENHRLRLEISVLSNRDLGQSAPVLLAVVKELCRLQGLGAGDQEGWIFLPYARLSQIARTSEGTIGRHVERGVSVGVFEKRTERQLHIGEIDPSTGEIRGKRFSIKAFFRANGGADLNASLARLANYRAQPGDPTAPRWGGKRLTVVPCPEHPDSQVVRRAFIECGECGKRLDSDFETPAPGGPAGGGGGRE